MKCIPAQKLKADMWLVNWGRIEKVIQSDNGVVHVQIDQSTRQSLFQFIKIMEYCLVIIE